MTTVEIRNIRARVEGAELWRAEQLCEGAAIERLERLKAESDPSGWGGVRDEC